MTTVVVPWRATPDRIPVWQPLRGAWEALGHRVIEGTCPKGPWRKGAAVTDGISRAAPGVVVVADADVWCNGVRDAITAVESGAAWAVPHYQVRRHGQAGELVERPYPGRVGGGMVVLTRDAYGQVPMDHRFAGWGQEDEAWGVALRTLLGPPWRGLADLDHFWHQPQERRGRALGSAENAALFRRYAAASGKPQAMRALLDEVR